jgi:chromosome segregation ATPase
MRTHRVLIACAFGILAMIPGRAAAQTESRQLTELLGEVRLLRQAVEAMGGVSVRVQIVFGRLQLQEQRVTASQQRLDAVRERLTGVTTSIAEFSTVLRQLEEGDPSGNPKKQEELNMMIRETRAQIAKLENERSGVIAEESDAANRLAQDQGQWSDLNRALEELERSLLPKRQ